MADEFSDLAEPESGGGSNEFSDLAEAEDSTPMQADRPTWGSAAIQEVSDMFFGIGHLGETAVIQGANLFPEADSNSILGFLQELAPKRAAEDVEALKKAPGAMVRSLGETFLGLVPGSDYSIYDKLKHQPIQTITDLWTPVSLVSGLAKTGGKAAAMAGQTATAKTLIGAGEKLAPTAIVKAGGKALQEVPGIGTVLKNMEVALDAQRWVRRETILGQKFSDEQMSLIERNFADVPAHERDLVIDLVEGTYRSEAKGLRPTRVSAAGDMVPAEPVTFKTLTASPLISAETKALVNQYRANNAVRQMKSAEILANGDPALRDAILSRFDNARFKPLAEKTSYELGAEVTAPQAKRLWEEGLIGSHELPPTYFPHITKGITAEHADNFVKGIEPYWHSSMKVRSGSLEYDRDFLRAVGSRERSLNKWLGHYNSTMAVVNTQGIPLHGLKTQAELADALAALKKAHGIDYVYFAPELYKHIFNAQSRASEKITLALAEPAQQMDGAIKKALQGAVGEFSDEYQAGLLAIIEDMKKGPDGPELIFTQGQPALPGQVAPNAGKATGPGAGRAKLYAIPRASAKRMLEEMGGVPDGLRAWGLAGDIWRAMILPLSPAWNIANTAGNTILATLSGSFNPKFRLKVKDYLLPDLQTAGIAGESRVLDNLSKADRAKITLRGLPVGEWYNKIADTLPGRMAASVTTFGYKVNEIVDTFMRESVAAGTLKKQAIQELRLEGKSGLTIDPKLIEERAIDIASDPIRARKATDFVNSMMGNYFDLTPWERNYVRNFAFPFWSWWKSMAKLSYTLPVKYPGRAQALQMLAAAREEANDDPLTPAELKGRLPIGPGTHGGTLMASTKSLIPMAQALEGFPSVHPAVSAGFMAMTGYNTIGQRVIPDDALVVGGRLYSQGDRGLPTELERGPLSWANTYSALRETIRGIPPTRFIESMIKGQTPRTGDPIFGSGQTNPLSPPTSVQDRWSALASTLGVQIKEYNEPLAKYRHAKRLLDAYVQGAKKQAFKDAAKSQDPITGQEDELEALLERLK